MIACLGGGIGAARLWRALASATAPEELTIVVNTADDVWMHGLRICPDVDTTLYALSGRQDVQRGWGVLHECFTCMETLRSLGEEVWFNLGDRDLATHLLRTGLLRAGATLTDVTARLAAGMGVRARVLPMTDAEVQTQVLTPEGDCLDYQEFLVRRGAHDEVARFDWVGIADSAPAPGVIDALGKAELVVLGPSNPCASTLPVLNVPGVLAALRATPAPVVAVTPIVSGVPIVDMGEAARARSRAALLRALGKAHLATTVAELYRDVVDVFVLDAADAGERQDIAELGVETITLPTLVHQCAPDDATRLAAWLLERARAAVGKAR